MSGKMPTEIILIGPPMAGKSTLAQSLARETNLPWFNLDELRWGYMKEIGYDKALDDEIRRRGGFLARALYWQLFGPYVIERFLAEHSHCIMDFGGGHTVYDSQESHNRVKRALAPYPNVILVLPSPDPEKSIKILSDRLALEPVELNFDFSRHFVEHPANHELAKHIIYTEGKSVDESTAEILGLISL